MRHRVIVSLIAVMCLLAAARARARVFYVSNTIDSMHLASLRGAIICANQIGGRNTIMLGRTLNPKVRPTPPWVYHLTLKGANEDQAQTGDLDITRGNLTIIGINPNIVIDATGLGDRVFQVFTNASLTLVNVTVSGGTAPPDNQPSLIRVGNNFAARIRAAFPNDPLILVPK